MSTRTRLLVVFVSTPVLVFVLIGGVLGKSAAVEGSYPHLRVFQDVVSLILNNYVEEPNFDRVLVGAMKGLAEGLDPDSAFLSAAEVKALDANAPAPEGSTGLQITRQYYLRVIAARDGSSAAKAGLRTGDYIRAIDGRPTRDMSVFEGSRLLVGQPGSKVSLLVIRGNAAEPHTLDLVRDRLRGSQITGRIQSPGIGYVRIGAFGPDVADALKSKVAELVREGADRLILDVRNTAEGAFPDGAAAAKLFVSGATIAIREGRTEARQTIDAPSGEAAIKLPAAILINTGTAGAAEVFVAALVAHRKSDTFGERTLGRAGIQKLVRLPDGSGLWMTSSRYLTPGGAAIQGKGLEPSVEVEEPEVEFGAAPPATDPILQKAVEKLSTQKAD